MHSRGKAKKKIIIIIKVGNEKTKKLSAFARGVGGAW